MIDGHVFASWGSHITMPQQVLNWIADLYDSVDGEERIPRVAVALGLDKPVRVRKSA